MKKFTQDQLTEILDFEYEIVDGIYSIRQYLHELLTTLWIEGEGFSSKRPFGNSGWEYDLYKPLVVGGWVDGVVEDDCIEEVDKKLAEPLVTLLINQMCSN